jgi:hypothetical protein
VTEWSVALCVFVCGVCYARVVGGGPERARATSFPILIRPWSTEVAYSTIGWNCGSHYRIFIDLNSLTCSGSSFVSEANFALARRTIRGACPFDFLLIGFRIIV